MAKKTPSRPSKPEAKLKKVERGDVQKKPTTAGDSKGGGGGRPLANRVRAANRLARLALASGELAAQEVERRRQVDARTLYVRFRRNRPESEVEVRQLVDGVKMVRIPRQCNPDRRRKDADPVGIKYAYLEFGSEPACEKAKELLDLQVLNAAADDGKEEPAFYVDFMGEKSKGFSGVPGQAGAKGRKGKAPINPTRLFVSGLTEGIDSEKLQLLFPKSLEAQVPKGSRRKGGVYGFVQFRNPADAKAAFDAAQKLTTADSGHHITVLFAKVSSRSRANPSSGPTAEKATPSATSSAAVASSVPKPSRKVEKRPAGSAHPVEKNCSKGSSEQSSDDEDDDDDREFENDSEDE